MDPESRGDEWNKKLLERLLYSNSDRLAIKNNDKGKNPYIWSQFDIAYIDGVEQKYACCKVCKTFIKYTGRTGTGGLMRHLCFRKLIRATSPVRARKGRPGPNEERDKVKLTKRTALRMWLEGLVHRNSPRIGYVQNAKGKSYIWSRFRIVAIDNIPTKFACCTACHSIVTYTGRTGTGGMTRHKCRTSKYVKGVDGDGPEPDPDDFGVVIKSEESFDWDEKGSSEHGDDVTRTPLRIVESEYKTGVDVKEEEEEDDLRARIPTEVERALEEEDEEGGMAADGDDLRTGIPTEVERVLQQKHVALLNKSLRLFDVFENEEFLELAQFLVNLGARYGPMDVKNIFKRKMSLVALKGDQ